MLPRFSKIGPCLHLTSDVSDWRGVSEQAAHRGFPKMKIVPSPAPKVWSILLIEGSRLTSLAMHVTFDPWRRFPLHVVHIAQTPDDSSDQDRENSLRQFLADVCPYHKDSF